MKRWFSCIIMASFRFEEAVSLWAKLEGFGAGVFIRVLKTPVFAASACIFVLGGGLVGSIIGAMEGQTTETGFLRGSIAGAVTSVQLLESMIDGEPLSKVALLHSLLNGKAFSEWVGPALLTAYQCQVTAILETTYYREISDIYDTNGVSGLSEDCIQKLPEFIYQSDSNIVVQCCPEFCCSICLQVTAILETTYYREISDIYDTNGVSGLSEDCIQKLPEFIYQSDSNIVVQCCPEFCCSICLQVTAILETTYYREISDIYDTNGVSGLSEDCIQKLPEFIYQSDSNIVVQCCPEFCCSICLQVTAILETTYYREISDIYDTNGVSGLSEDCIQKLPEFIYQSDSNIVVQCCPEFCCSICLQDFKDWDSMRKLPYCEHYFHLECIDEWLTRNGSCPMCRNYVCSVDDDVV